MWPLLVLVLLGLASCGSAQLIFNITDSVEYTKDNKTILIPCIVNNLGAKDLEEMFVKWRFRGKQIFYYDGYKNESQSTSDFSSAYFVPDTLLSGNASLIMDKSDAVPGNYTCEVTELTREGETTIELKYRIVKTQLLFKTIKSVDYTNDNKTVLIPCLVTNSEAKSLKEMLVKWKFKDKYIFTYDGGKNEAHPSSEFSSSYIVPDALLTGNASLMMDKSHAVPGIYTCEVSELSKEGETTIELKYPVDKTQLLFTTIESVDYTICNETLLTIPCLVTNVGAMSLKEMFVKWRLGDKQILFYDGDKNETNPISDFPSAYIIPNALLTGDASLMMDKSDAVPGNYTCEVTELTREGETTIELKYHIALWFSANDYVLTIIFPMLAVLLFWGSDIVTLKYNSNITKEKIIILSVAGLVLSILVIVGAVFFIPGEYSTKRASGLGLIVASTVILILLQISMFLIAPAKRKLPISVILLIVQVLGLLISVVGLSFCVSECIPVHGSLLISGLGITTLGALLGLVYMIFVAGSKQNTIHPQTDKKNRSDGL
ncbi:PREDICTED: leukocyte surface antigen CD47-like isoform X1 [Myotis brandtii]|uniref:leukocyte surface antigen CD47-like isoform X1 n=1 Tax=Myotis brandtii TaxID=109478 RepID=UPI0007047BAE|nr:PREDICTED: leukocyte surface antigen CD47-like isoform X1 [Myotis brandtii]